MDRTVSFYCFVYSIHNRKPWEIEREREWIRDTKKFFTSVIGTGVWNRETVRDHTLVSITCIALTAVLFTTGPMRTVGSELFAPNFDHRKYYLLASAPAECDIAPFCWRILVPTLARYVPGSIQFGFIAVTFVSLVLVGIVLFAVVRQFNFSSGTAVVGVFMFYYLNNAADYLTGNFWLVDSAAFFFILLAIYAILTDRDILFIASLTIGVLAKEAVLFALPLYYTFNARRLIDVPVMKRNIAYGIAPVALVFGVRSLINTQGSPPIIDRAVEILLLRYERIQSNAWRLLGYTTGPFGLLFILPLLNLKRNLRLLLIFLPYIGFTYFQIFLAVNTSRLIVYGFPLLVLMSLVGLETLSDNLSDVFPNVSIRPIHFSLLFLFMTGIWILRDDGLRSPHPIGLEVSALVLYILGIVLVAGCLEFMKHPHRYFEKAVGETWLRE